ncbi:MAG: NAD/FAD-dependent oxidoreductase, partial [Cyanobacteriota bacterium]
SFWHVQAKDGREFTSQALIMTCPIPQALFLLKQSKLVLPSNLLGRLESIIYSRCIAGLAILENDSDIPEPGGVRLDNESISWLACNRKKGISHSNAITLLTTPEFSIRHWDDDDSQIALLMVDSARPYLGSEVLDAHIHRWRYSQPCTFFGDHYLALREPGVLIMAGDAFSPNHTISPILNLERAALSGLQAANYYIQNQDYFV